MAFPGYSTGTVSVASGGTVVTGVGSVWSTANVRQGDDIIIGGRTVIVEEVTDSTHLVIDPWPDSAVSGVAYKTKKRSPLWYSGGQAMSDVSKLVAALNTTGFFVFVGSSETAPDPSYGEEGQYASQPSTGKLWLSTGGSWVYLGVYKAFRATGAWSIVTAYDVGDIATLSGTSYLCKVAHTGFTPPNTSYWQILAAKGDKGDSGATYGGTSTSSLVIGTGTKAFTTQAGLAYTNGARVRATDSSTPSNWMEGVVTYSGSALTMTADKVSGSGTIASWNLNIAGQPGAGDLSSSAQSLTAAQKAQVWANLGIAPGTGVFNGKIVESRASNTATFSLVTLAGNTPSGSDPVLVNFPDGSSIVQTAACTFVLGSGSTMGVGAAVGLRLWFALVNDGGTLRLAARNCAGTTGGIQGFSANGILSSSAESGGIASTNRLNWSNTAVTAKPFVIVAFAEYDTGLATAGLWASAPSRIVQWSSGMPLAGSVLQEMQMTASTSTQTTSTSYVTTTLSSTFTPSHQANFIEYDVTGGLCCDAQAYKGWLTMSIGGTLVGITGETYSATAGSYFRHNVFLKGLYRPNSVSALTCGPQLKTENAANNVRYPYADAANGAGAPLGSMVLRELMG